MKGTAITGNFDYIKENEIIFHGLSVFVSEEYSSAGKGIFLFDQKMTAGKISADITFHESDENNCAELIFSYINESNYWSAGIVDGVYYKYVCDNTQNGKRQPLRYSGYGVVLPNRSIHLELEITSNCLSVKIDNVMVFQQVPLALTQLSQVGILVESKGDITISNYCVEAEKPQAFIISKFGGSYNQIFRDVIKPLCDERNIKAVRADEINASTLILQDIIRDIKTSTLIIADISINNPNVFYELGYAHAIGKPVILLSEKGTRKGLPFDVSGYRTIYYENSIGGKNEIEKKLGEYIDETFRQLGY